MAIGYSIDDNGAFDSDPTPGLVGDPVGPAVLRPLLPPESIPTLDSRALAVLIGLFAVLIGFSIFANSVGVLFGIGMFLYGTTP